MIDYDKLNEILGDQIKLTPLAAAKIFCNMDADDIADFFNHIKNISDLWVGSFCMQMQFVSESKNLSPGAKEIMRIIGEFGYD